MAATAPSAAYGQQHTDLASRGTPGLLPAPRPEQTPEQTGRLVGPHTKGVALEISRAATPVSTAQEPPRGGIGPVSSPLCQSHRHDGGRSAWRARSPLVRGQESGLVRGDSKTRRCRDTPADQTPLGVPQLLYIRCHGRALHGRLVPPNLLGTLLRGHKWPSRSGQRAWRSTHDWARHTCAGLRSQRLEHGGAAPHAGRPVRCCHPPRVCLGVLP